MWPLARVLQRDGWRPTIWTYRTWGRRIEEHAERLSSFLVDLEDRLPSGDQYHLVTHSMGGIITRCALGMVKPERLQRIVMLAPPHQGSHAARKLAPWLGWLTPSLGQLSDAPTSFVNSLSNPLAGSRYEFGIIEAARDRVIAPGRVALDGAADLAEVDGHHGILTWYPSTAKLVRNFLKHGQFRLPSENGSPATREASGPSYVNPTT